MGYFKETKINLPKELLEFNKNSKKSRRNLLMQHNFKNKKDESVKKAYENMAEINLSFAEMGMSSDLYSLEDYEGELEQNGSKE
ncbi:hypothetical protein [Helicovermis profundi]|uniref:Uncharacterized protein n=1 Tax=Helicovermis profundi TaxID=3065157 RepID=A0AAU9EJX4_9FIRM|nr:hypothetical protein HLPR_05900 [Clostridia bacterium S502]